MMSSMLAALVSPAMGIVYVDENASGNDDGTSWTDAYPSLVDALANCPSGEHMWVAEGTYSPGGGDGDSFYVTNNVIFGGFQSGDSFGDRDPVNNVTILDGANKNTHVVECSQDNTAVIDGFTIQDGDADGTGVEDDGAAIYLFEGDLVVSNCVFTGNSADAQGGAVWIASADTPSPRFVNCTFESNTAVGNRGGAVYLESGQGSPIFSNCTFEANTAGDSVDERGGAIYGEDGGTLYVIDSMFTNNGAFDEGGAIGLAGDAGGLTLEAWNTEFWNNTGDDAGGAIYMSSYGSGHVISNCVFSGNIATNNGGAIFGQNLEGITIYGTSFPTNRANSTGGGLRLGLRSGFDAVIDNCQFTNNNVAAGTHGGAVYFEGSSSGLTITNSHFEGCSTGSNSDGGAVYVFNGGSLYLTDTVFTNCTAGRSGGAVWASGSSGSWTITNSHFEACSAGSSGDGGAVRVESGATFYLADTVFTNCSTGDDGGALSLSATKS